MPRVRTPLIALVLLVGAAGTVRAQGNGIAGADTITVEAAGNATPRVDPARTVTASFRIANHGTVRAAVQLHTELPDTWSSVFSGGEIVLNGGETRVQYVIVRIPEGAAPGLYEIVLAATDSRGHTIRARRRVEVNRKCHFRLEAESQTRFVESGKGLEAMGRIVNSGNIDLTIRLAVRSARGYEARLDSSHVYVPAGGVAEFQAAVQTADNVGGKELRALIITAEAQDCPGVADDAAVLFDVIPRADSRVGDDTRFSGTLMLGAAGRRGAAGVQVGYEASGFIDRAETRRLDLAVRAPDQRRVSRFGRRGLARATYESSNVSLSVGDTRFGYSTLTRVPGIGRGAALTIRHGPLTAGAFAEKNRLGFPVRSRQGVLLGFRTTEWTSFGATYLRRVGVDRGETVTVFATANPAELANLSLEFGDAVAGTSRTGAMAMELTGRKSHWVQYSGKLVYAGAGFPGQYSDLRFRQGAITVRPGAGFSLQSSAKIERQSFQGTAGWVREDRRIRAGVGWRGGEGQKSASFKLEYGRQERETVTDARLGLLENEVQLTTGVRRGRVAASAYASAGRLTGNVLQDRGDYRQIGVSTEASFGAHMLAASFDHFQGASIERPQPGNSSSLRMGLVSRLGAATRVQIDGFLSHDDFWGGFYELLHVRLSQSIGEAEVTARLQYTSIGNAFDESSADFGLALRMPLSTPNPFRSPVKRLGGRVVDMISGSPVSGVHVQLGESHSLTDEVGSFRLRRPVSGSHSLIIDSSTLDVDMVPMIEIPMELHLTPADTPDIEVPVARAGRLAGRFLALERQGSLDVGAGKRARPVVLAVLQIDDGIGTYRTVTNVAGKFIFPKIRPGKYRVSVVLAELPRRYRTDRESYTVVVEPGNEETLEILAVPDDRGIRIIQGGELDLRDPDTADEQKPTQGKDVAPGKCSTAAWAARETSHRVAPGESLSLIARQHFGDALLWPVVWLRNGDRIRNPDLIPAGVVLWIPARRFESFREGSGGQVHRAVPGETASSLAKKVLGMPDLWPLVGSASRADEPIAPGANIWLPGLRVREISPQVCTDRP